MSDSLFKVGDVVVRSRKPPMRLTVVGWTSRGKLRLLRPNGTELRTWWTYVSSPPKGYHVERDGVRIT